MAHEIEQFTDGTAAFASARKSAWHGLGTVTTGAMTAEEAMATAYLSGWDVRLLGLSASDITPDGVRSIEVPSHFASVRTHPKTGHAETLGVVGTDYHPVQNEEHAEFLNLLADESGAHFETAGSLKGGRQVFLTMKLPTGMTLGGRDRTDLYIAALNSHDGSTAFRVVVTPIRVVCANTQRAAIKGAVSSYAVRHTSGATARIAQARQALGLVWEYADQFEQAAQRMIEAEMTLSELRTVVDKIWDEPKSDSPRAKTNSEQRWGQISHLFTQAESQAEIRGTRWAGYNAITEYANHFAPSRGRTAEEKTAARAERVISGSADALMERAFALTAV
ncbi:DUF932 domain-containing protein [Streptomyces sp. NPDC090053]|uniref:DUF932 domain-containing protein n=1 Tax=Streptomyces sp. NPDC090053 TaxID=3365932 RepID=UPI00381E0369